MSFICKCLKSFEINVAFSKHCSYEHIEDYSTNSFQCLGACTRKYDRLDSFRKHLRANHLLPSNLVSHPESNINSECDISINDIVFPTTPAEWPCMSNVEEDTESNFKTYIESIEQLPLIQDNLPQSNINLSIEHCIHRLTSKWYSDNNMPRKKVQSNVEDVANLFSDVIGILSDNVASLLKVKNISISIQTDVHKIFSDVLDAFSNVDTEYMRLKKFRDSGHLIAPENVLLGTISGTKLIHGQSQINSEEVFAQFIPIRNVFRIFFEQSNVFQRTLLYMRYLTSNTTCVSNFVQCSLWKKTVAEYGSKIVFPVFIYFDEYESNNVLGSHSGDGGKLGALYIQIPCLPPEFLSKLENIFLFQLINALHRKIFGNLRTFQRVIDELNFLSKNGISIKTNEGTYQIYFVLGLVLGDNLGLNSLLGFVESFQAHYWCRCCLINKNDAYTITAELPELIRTPQSYEQIISNFQSDSNINKYGIKEKCVWNLVHQFDVAKNFSVDAMHDLLEGICKYELADILYNFIFKEKIISADTINDRINSFGFGRNERRNKPPELSPDHIKQLNLKLSASEVHCLMRHFGLFIGDLISEDNKIWEVYTTLSEILNIVLAKVYTIGCPDLLENLISENLELYQTVFKKSLKPKHHLLIHYPKIMKIAGPVVHFWSMRFESKHRESKIAARATVSRRNLAYTLALKHQLKLHHKFRTSVPLLVPIYGPIMKIHVRNLPDHANIVRVLPKNINPDELKIVKWIEYMGTEAHPNDVIMVMTEIGPTFSIIKYIILCLLDKQIYFLADKIESLYYDSHFQAYHVNPKKLQLSSYKLENIHDVTCMIKQPNGNTYVVNKW